MNGKLHILPLVTKADDITMFCSDKNICAVRDMMTEDLGSIYVWLKNNQLILNWDKTKAMCFSYSSHNQIDPHILPTNIFISIDGHDIGFVDEFRLLGVTVDNKLTFDTQIRNICSILTQNSSDNKKLKIIPLQIQNDLIQAIHCTSF